MTDTATTRPYGVLGRVLGHSYTPTIYKELAGLEYVRFAVSYTHLTLPTICSV